MTSTHSDSRRLPEGEDHSVETPHEALEGGPSAGAGEAFELIFSDINLRRVVESATVTLETTRRERAAGPALAAKLEEQPETRALLLIENDPRFQTWGLVCELMERSDRAVFEADPLRAIRLARLATEVASKVDPGVFGEALTHDLQARAWTNLGNAYRYGSHLRAAGEALRRAGCLLAAGTGDPLEEANLLSIRASLALGTGSYGESLGLLARAEQIYVELGEWQLLGKILVQRAGAIGWEEPGRGIALALEAERYLDPTEDARLFLMARHNRILWLIEAGMPEQAETLFQRSAGLYRSIDDGWTFLHRAWAEARLAAALAEVQEAEASLEVLLAELLDREYRLDAALCALELAGCYLRQGQTRKASELAAAMAQHLREWGAHARARDAWAVLQQALAMEKATDALLRQLGRYLQRAWRNPHLAFQPRSSPRSRA